MTHLSYPVVEGRAKTVFLSFLKAKAKIESRKDCFRDFYSKIVGIQRKFKDHMLMVRLRVMILKKVWDREKMDLINQISSQGKKKNRAIIAKLIALEDAVRDFTLNKYIAKCYLLYNATFFKWHAKVSRQRKHIEKISLYMSGIQRLSNEEENMVDLDMEQEALKELLSPT